MTLALGLQPKFKHKKWEWSRQVFQASSTFQRWENAKKCVLNTPNFGTLGDQLWFHNNFESLRQTCRQSMWSKLVIKYTIGGILKLRY